MIFIVGGNGFVGSAIANECKNRKLEYRIVTRDNFEEMRNIHCDVLINANGNSKKYMADRDPIWEFEASVKSVHEYLSYFSYDKYIQLSSCDVYNDCSNYNNTKEESFIDIEGNQSSYGFHKYLAEQCVRHYADNWIIFRMGGFVGPGLKKNAIYDILHNETLWLDPKSRLQFISTEAAASIILDISFSDTKNEIINLCGDGTVLLQDVIDSVDFSGKVDSNAKQVKYEVNVDKIKNIVLLEKSEDAVLNFVEKMKGKQW